VPDTHQTVVTHSSIECEPTAVRTGDKWTQTLLVGEYPDTPMDSLFETLYSTAATRQTDISLHISPRETTATLDTLEDIVGVSPMTADGRQTYRWTNV
jgi:hypothetical protein